MCESERDAESLCVEGACRARGCGDGWREPGDEGHAREVCDDGDVASGAFCDASCEPTVGALINGITLEEAADLAIALDGEGHLLALTVERAGGAAVVRGHRFDRHLASMGEPLELARVENDRAAITPVVAGLDRGWAFALVQGGAGVMVGVLELASRTTPTLVAWDARITSSVEPAIAALDDGFVVLAVDPSGGVDDPLGGVRARLFDRSGRPRGDSFPVPADRSGLEVEPVVAASGSAWMAAWMAREASGVGVRVVASVFTGRTPLGRPIELTPEALEPAGTPKDPLAPGVASWSPALTALDDGRFAIAWIESRDSMTSIRAAALSETGVRDDAVTIAATDRALLSPRLVPTIEGGFALFYVEGARNGEPRVAVHGAGGAGLTEAISDSDTDLRIASRSPRVLVAWRDAASATVRARLSWTDTDE